MMLIDYNNLVHYDELIKQLIKDVENKVDNLNIPQIPNIQKVGTITLIPNDDNEDSVTLDMFGSLSQSNDV